MKKNTILSAFGLLALLTCCSVEDDFAPIEGLLTARIEGNETKASFDGSTGKFAWNTGDEIAVHVSDPSLPDGQFLTVQVTPQTDPSEAHFNVSETASTVVRNFYAVYPASAAVAESYGNPLLQITLPSLYDISDIVAESSSTDPNKRGVDYAPLPMIAANITTQSVLYFRHVGGLLRLNCNSVPAGTRSIKVTVDKAITGTFSVKNPNSEIPTIDTSGEPENNFVVFTIAGSGGLPAETNGIALNIPVPCGEYGPYLIQTFTSADGTGTPVSEVEILDTHTFDRTHGWKLPFFDCKIELPISDIERTGAEVITPYSEDVTVSVKRLNGVTVAGDAPWKAYFYTSRPSVGDPLSSSWSTTPLQDANGEDWLSLSAYSGDGNDNPVTVSLKAAELQGTTRNLMTDANAMRTTMQSGSGVTNLDLSKYNFLNGATNAAVETANCYIIKSYGSYLIPCVYGNAYAAGSLNAVAYSNSTTTEKGLKTFVNADGRPIANAVITRDGNLTKSSNLSARVVWQDTHNQPGFQILTDDDLEYVASNGTAVNCPYIRVTFQQDKIVPGNVVIALYDNDNEKILWSWHLWVTTQTFKSETFKSHDNTTVYHLLNVNLGWTPPISYSGGTTTAREQYVILVSTTNNAVVDAFKVSQAQYDEPDIDAKYYASTYYQWGRKDPFLPSTGDGNHNKSISYPEDFPAMNGTHLATFVCSEVGASNDARLGAMIQYPYGYATTINSNDYPSYFNLWNANGETSSGTDVIKTVYDPCPRGFHVPRNQTFTGTTHNGQSSDGVGIPWCTYVPASGEQPNTTMFTYNHTDDPASFVRAFPLSGHRKGIDSDLDGVSSSGRFWSATSFTYGNQGYHFVYGENTAVPNRDFYRIHGVTIRPSSD